jgi:hypothetical protein
VIYHMKTGSAEFAKCGEILYIISNRTGGGL